MGIGPETRIIMHVKRWLARRNWRDSTVYYGLGALINYPTPGMTYGAVSNSHRSPACPLARHTLTTPIYIFNSNSHSISMQRQAKPSQATSHVGVWVWPQLLPLTQHRVSRGLPGPLCVARPDSQLDASGDNCCLCLISKHLSWGHAKKENYRNTEIKPTGIGHLPLAVISLAFYVFSDI